jgi:GxxExxY protein
MKTITLEELNPFSSIILDSCITVHKAMGPGLLESIYHHCLVKELRLRNLKVESMVPVPLSYRGEELNKTYIIDLLIESEIIVEIKAIDGILPIHEAQILSYLKLAHKRMGLLINFNVRLLKEGFKRFVN